VTKNNVILLVGRDDWQKDEALNLALISRLRNNDVEIIWEDPAAEVIYFFRRIEKKFEFLPVVIKKYSLRLVKILYGLFHPSYFFYLYQRKNKTDVMSRCKSLKNLIGNRGIAERTIVLSRSSGGRVSSLIADELNLKHIVCLGYPFKHPDQGDEPDRYSHLAKLKTPMFIIQGTHDEYGGLEIENKYALSDSIKLVFFNTDHSFNINEAMAHEIVEKIESMVGLTKKHSN